MKTWRGRKSKNRNEVDFILTSFHVNECLKCSDGDDCSAAIQHAGRFWLRRLKLMLWTELNSHFNDSISCVGVKGGSDQLVVELVSFTRVKFHWRFTWQHVVCLVHHHEGFLKKQMEQEPCFMYIFYTRTILRGGNSNYSHCIAITHFDIINFGQYIDLLSI